MGAPRPATSVAPATTTATTSAAASAAATASLPGRLDTGLLLGLESPLLLLQPPLVRSGHAAHVRGLRTGDRACAGQGGSVVGPKRLAQLLLWNMVGT